MSDHQAYMRQNEDGNWDIFISKTESDGERKEYKVDGGYFMKPIANVVLGMTLQGIRDGFADIMIAHPSKRRADGTD